MNLNMGIIDRTVRILLALAIAILIILKVLTGIPAIVLGIIGGIFVVTSLVGTCPIYLPFKISTKKKEKKPGRSTPLSMMMILILRTIKKST